MKENEFKSSFKAKYEIVLNEILSEFDSVKYYESWQFYNKKAELFSKLIEFTPKIIIEICKENNIEINSVAYNIMSNSFTILYQNLFQLTLDEQCYILKKFEDNVMSKATKLGFI